MAGSPEASSTDAETIARFGPGSRIVHWAHAVPFLLLLFSGLLLYVQPIKAVNAGGFRLVSLLHVLIGIVFIASPIPLYLTLPARSAVHDDLRRLFRLERGDPAWGLYALGSVFGARVPQPPAGKFNLGQKLNTAFSVVVTLGLMASGAVLAVNFFTKSVFPARFVEQVFPLHDIFMVVAIPVVAAHVYLGSLNPSTRESLRGITGGRVSRAWARAHHAAWVDEIDSR
jgi:formate dehydrogenase subunit gamma